MPQFTYIIYLSLIGMDSSERRLKNQSFRKHIRRQELDNYFQERRREMLSQQQEEQINSFVSRLQSTLDQQRFLQKSAHELTGEPKIEWLSTIKYLRYAVSVFHGQFHLWLSKSIMKNLCLVFTQQYKDIPLAGEVTELLNDMVYESFKEDTPFTRNLMEYEFVPDVLTLASDRTQPMENRISYIMLLSKIANVDSKFCVQIIRDGAGSVLAEISKDLQSMESLNQKLLGIYLQSFVCFFQASKKGNKIQLINIASTSLNFIIGILQLQINWPTMSYCLDALISILKLERHPLYTTMYLAPSFCSSIFPLFNHKEITIRTKVAHLISYFTFSETDGIPKDLLERGLLDLVYYSYEKMESKKSIYFTKNCLNMLSNLAAEPLLVQFVANHSVFQIVIEQMNAESVDIQKECIYALHTFIQNLQYHKMETILNKYDIISQLSLKLLDHIRDSYICIETLQIFNDLVMRSSEVFHTDKDNPIIKKMEMYNVSSLAENIRNSKGNKKIEVAADILITSIQRAYYESMDSL